MITQRIEAIAFWIVKGGFFLLPFVVLIVSPWFLFPYITGKNFAFRFIVELMGAAWIFLIAINPRRYLPKPSLFLWILTAFIGIVTLATFFGVDPARSFWSNYERMEGFVTYLHLFALALVALGVLRTKEDWKPLLLITLAVSVFVAFYGLLERVGAVETDTGGDRIFSTFGNPIYLARYLMFSMMLLALLVARVKGIALKLFLGLLLVFESYIFFRASTRGAFLGIAAGFGVALVSYLWFTRGSRLPEVRLFRRCAFGFLIAGVVAGGALFLLRDYPYMQKNSITAPIISLYQALLNPTVSTPGARLMIWDMAWQSVKERPLLGWGPDNFIVPYARYYNPRMFGNEPWFDRVHNMVLEWFVTAGIVGGLLYLALFGALFYYLFVGYKKNIFFAEEAALLTGLLAAYLIQNFFVFDTIESYLLFFGVACYVAARFSKGTTAAEQPSKLLKKTMRRVAAGAFGAVLVLSSSIFFVFQPMAASARLIDAFALLSKGVSAETVVATFEQVFKKGTFGITEARERLADTLFFVSNRYGVTPKTAPGFLMILELATREMEKEVKAHPHNMRPLIFLGRLYHLQVAITGHGGDKALAAYEKVVEVAPNYVEIYIDITETYLARGNKEKALMAVEEGLLRAPSSVIMIEKAALTHVLLDDFDGALDIVSRKTIKERDGTFREVDHDRLENVAKRSMDSSNILPRLWFLQELATLAPESEKIRGFLTKTEAEFNSSPANKIEDSQ